MSEMRAMVVAEVGGKLRMVERDVPAPGPREVRLRVQACAVCHGDVFTVQGLMPGVTYPRVPGHEVIGTVDAVGSEVRGWDVGMRAGVGWFGGSCGHCGRCRRGDAFACETFTAVTGVTRDGGYATHMLADWSALAHVPKDLEGVASAPLLCAGVTTFNALRNCGAGPGDLVAVVGVGGLGHLAIQFAARMGLRTVAVGRGHGKEELARALGAHEYIDNTASDPAKALQTMGGAKAILATVTAAEAMESIAGGLGPNGTMMLIGVVPSMKANPIDLLTKRASLKGWYSGTSIDSEDTLRFSQQNAIRSTNELYPFEQAQAAYDRMMSGKARFRVVLTMS